jgi:hypothetical protein
MQKLNKWYRKDYHGENVVGNLIYDKQKWEISEEWVPNSVVNNQISNQACIIGNGISRKEFNLSAVIGHHGGLLGRMKLQTYGCNALYRDHTPDFLVVSGEDDGIVSEVANSGYCDNNIVYASIPHIMRHPEKFYSIPQDLAWNAGSVATYLAAFDGHKRVYMIGFDGQDTAGINYNMFAGTPNYQGSSGAQADPAFLDLTMKTIFTTYGDVDFVRVMPSKYTTIPESWKYCTNLRQISFRDFVIEADL